MRAVLKTCFRPFYLLVRALCRPFARRFQGYLASPVLPELRTLQHALKTLPVLQEVPALRQEFNQHSARVQEQHNALRAHLDQIALLVVQLRDHQAHVLGQLAGQFASQQGTLRETDRLLVALLKNAQLGPTCEAEVGTPRIYRECANK